MRGLAGAYIDEPPPATTDGADDAPPPIPGAARFKALALVDAADRSKGLDMGALQRAPMPVRLALSRIAYRDAVRLADHAASEWCADGGGVITQPVPADLYPFGSVSFDCAELAAFGALCVSGVFMVHAQDESGALVVEERTGRVFRVLGVKTGLGDLLAREFRQLG